MIETLVSFARERGEEAVVFTFWPHPRTVLQQDARDLRLLTSLEEKKELLFGLGVDRVEMLPFTREFAALTGEAYVTMLREDYGVSQLVMGYDNRLGSDHLTASAQALPTLIVDPVDGISSTKIRKVLGEGDVEMAAGMLGYRYGLHGVVVAGNRKGRTIGFPTANMQLYEPLKLVPGNGAYAVEVEVLGRQWKGMCNIGLRPTGGGKARTIETNIFAFDEDIYGLPMKLRFVRRLRDEICFPSLEALRAQLEKDRDACF